MFLMRWIIIKNLLENAFVYSSLCENKRPHVEINIQQENSDLLINVRDNGEGIDKKVRKNVWNMFFVGNERSKGNGLGLYITQKAVKVLEGKISYITLEKQFMVPRVRWLKL